MNMDNEYFATLLSTKEWSYAESTGDRVTVGSNNSLWVRQWESLDESSIWKPMNSLGGSFSFDVDVSSQESGCVAGVYLVDTDDMSCAEVDQYGVPQCKSIDLMQANLYGFETKANPCTNGTCDAVSQCIVGMQEQGWKEYGYDAYGPGGFLIDTNAKFNVRTQLLSEDN